MCDSQCLEEEVQWSDECVYRKTDDNLYNRHGLHCAVFQEQSSHRFRDVLEDLAVKGNPDMPKAATVQEPVLLRMSTYNGGMNWIVQCTIFLCSNNATPILNVPFVIDIGVGCIQSILSRSWFLKMFFRCFHYNGLQLH